MFKVPDTKKDLVDEYVKITASYNELKKRKDMLRERILELGQTSINGSHWAIDIKLVVSERLDTERVKQFLGKRLPDYVKTVETQRISTRPK